MPTINKPRRFKRLPNATVINFLRPSMSNDFKARIPVLNAGNIEQAMRDLDNYLPGQNAIIAAMMNKVGLTNLMHDVWDNPWSAFKAGELTFGESVEEVTLGLVNAIAYDTDRETGERIMFSRETPEVATSYHTINRESIYKITIDNVGEVRKAFHSEYGLSDFIEAQFASVRTSMALDEFNLMADQLRKYAEHDAFFKVNVPDVADPDSDERASKTLLRKIREYAAEVETPNRAFNSAGMPTFARADDLVIITTAGVKAALDIEALASVFHLDKAEVPARIYTVPMGRWFDDGTQAILTTRKFFQVYDVLNTVREVENGAGLYTNHIFHVHQIISNSRFVPAIAFTTAPGTVLTEDVWTVTGISAHVIKNVDTEATVTTVARGGVYTVEANAVVTEAGDKPDGVYYTLTRPGTSVQTRIGGSGVLIIGNDETAATAAVTIRSVHDASVSKDIEIEITGDVLSAFPPALIPEAEGELPE